MHARDTFRTPHSSDLSTDTDDSEMQHLEDYDHSPGSKASGRRHEDDSVASSSTTYQSDTVKGRVAERARQFQCGSTGSESKKPYRTSTVLHMSNQQS